MREIASKTLGNIGETIEDGPLGTALRELAEITLEYITTGESHIYADALAEKAMEVSHMMVDVLEELGLVSP